MAYSGRRLSWRRIGQIAAVLFLLELITPIFIGYPGPVSLTYVFLYNGTQAARTWFPNLTSRWRQRRAAGPPPDARVITASNNLGIRLLKTMAAEHPGQNVFFSPYGTSAAMAMTATGAAGPTRRAMWSALGLDGVDEAAVCRSYERIETLLSCTDPRVEVLSANSLWADEQARLRPDYAGKAERAFHAGVEQADLQSPLTTDRISRWVTDHTGGRIRGVAPERDPYSALVLANALYFHGKWRSRFDRDDTYNGTFRLDDGSSRQVPMMNQAGAHIDVYGTGEDYSVSRLPYGDGSMSMLVFLPDRYRNDNEQAGLAVLLKELSPQMWERSVRGLEPRTIGFSMPRFRIEAEPDAESALKSAGFRPAFSPDADFSVMSAASAGVYISRIRQKAFLDVNEEGTTAGSIVLHDMRMAGIPDSIRVDHPFLCAIRDDRTGLILFLGAIYDPSAL